MREPGIVVTDDAAPRVRAWPRIVVETVSLRPTFTAVFVDAVPTLTLAPWIEVFTVPVIFTTVPALTLTAARVEERETF
jgi:hypothetical protein